MEKIKTELKTWAVYFITLLSAIFLHEVGHCIPAWVHGYSAMPTFAKEYPLSTMPGSLANSIALGGIIGSAVFSVIAEVFFIKTSFRYRSAVLAGALAMPSIYTFRFILSGRGHDGTEFQQAQSALGFNYFGHFVDWMFIGIVISGIVLWIIISNPEVKVIGRLIVGGILSLGFVVALQTINNSIFDPLFLK